MNPWKIRLIVYYHRKVNRCHRNADRESSGISNTAMIKHLSANDFCNDYFMLYDTGISA